MPSVAEAANYLPAFRTRFPEFTTTAYPDAVVILALSDAITIFGACETAFLYLAAHLLSIRGEAGVTVAAVDGGFGEVQSESIGSKSVSYKSMADKGRDTFYTTTAYGRQFLVFRAACGPRAFSVRVY